MSLFCGRIKLAGEEAGEPDWRALDSMLAALAGKGAGAPARASLGGATMGWKAATKDSPEAADHHCVTDAAARRIIVGNVRIDNRADLARTLERELSGTGSRSDLALTLAAYARWGADCAPRLVGDFAFVVWDAALRRGFAARDHMGVAPFYYCARPDALAFGSDLGAVADAPGVPGDLNLFNIAETLDIDAPPPPGETYLKAVRRLQPGHVMIFGPEGARERVWWRPQDAPDVRYRSDEDYIQACRALIAQAVRDRAPDHDHAGCHVSGGLDSSAIAAIMVRDRRAAGRPDPACLSWTPAPEPGDAGPLDTAMLAAFCSAEGISPHRAITDVAAILEYFSADVVRHPLGRLLWAELPVQRAAQALGVTTILSGHGGDQCVSFGGRGYFPSLLLSGNLARLAKEARAMGDPAWRVAARGVRELGFDAITHLYSAKPFALHPGRETYKRRGLAPFNPANRASRGIPWSIRAAQNEAVAPGYIDIRIEGWAEHGARRGIVYAYPLLDRRLMEFALGLPPELHYRNGTNRWLMRQAALDWAPDRVVANPSKAEPARGRRMVDALDQAIPALLQAVRELDPASPRRSLVDVERLERKLRDDPIRREPGRGPAFARVRAALEFLDLNLNREAGAER